MGDSYSLVMKSGGEKVIFRNGKKLDNVIDVSFNAGVDKSNTICITLSADIILFDGDAVSAYSSCDFWACCNADKSKSFCKDCHGKQFTRN